MLIEINVNLSHSWSAYECNAAGSVNTAKKEKEKRRKKQTQKQKKKQTNKQKKPNNKQTNKANQNHTNTHTHTPLLVKRVNWGYLYTPIQTGTFECGYTPVHWGYTKYECDYTPITWGYPNAPSIGDMLLNAFIWHFRSHAGNAQMGTSPVGSVSTFPLAESDVCPRFTPFTNAHPHTPHTHPTSPTHPHVFMASIGDIIILHMFTHPANGNIRLTCDDWNVG